MIVIAASELRNNPAVIPNYFGISRNRQSCLAGWMLKQVQHDRRGFLFLWIRN